MHTANTLVSTIVYSPTGTGASRVRARKILCTSLGYIDTTSPAAPGPSSFLPRQSSGVDDKTKQTVDLFQKKRKVVENQTTDSDALAGRRAPTTPTAAAFDEIPLPPTSTGAAARHQNL